MSDNELLQSKVRDAIRNPKNLGELKDADAVGTVGNPECGEMLQVWVKYRDEGGKKVIDQASFQSFGCETAIAVASMATELIRGKTPEEALNLKGEALAPDLGPLPPMKIHCAELVEKALRSALGEAEIKTIEAAPQQSPSLLDRFSRPESESAAPKIVFLPPET